MHFIKISDKTLGAVLVNINFITGIFRNQQNQCIVVLNAPINDYKELTSNDNFDTIQKALAQYSIPVID